MTDTTRATSGRAPGALPRVAAPPVPDGLERGQLAHERRLVGHQEACVEGERLDAVRLLWRTAKPAKHLVSDFLLVDWEHVLLVDHINAGLWLPTGGHVEPGEHP